MRYISVFSGVEAATVAWEPLGWEPVAFSEIDEFPSAVLAQRFPNVPNLGDITKVDWSEYAGKVDIVVGGSPCQSFSVAGSRTGLDGASGLMWEYVRCVREIRPRWFVWENVPGALSSTHGEDFRCLLQSMDELGYGMAWRVLDAQFFGVAQRRRRVFLVGSLGDRRAADVLFESDCLRRDSPSSRNKRKSLAEGTQRSIGKCLPFDTTQVTSPQNGSNPKWEDPCHPLCAAGHTPTIIYMADDNAKAATDRDMCGSPKVGGSAPIVAKAFAQNTRDEVRYIGGDGAVSGALAASPGMKQTSYAIVGDKSGYVVRKLTPRECERLQGFPDDWTLIDWKGKPAPDGKRYKAMGNSMCVNVMRWIGVRIDAVDKKQSPDEACKRIRGQIFGD